MLFASLATPAWFLVWHAFVENYWEDPVLTHFITYAFSRFFIWFVYPACAVVLGLLFAVVVFRFAARNVKRSFSGSVGGKTHAPFSDDMYGDDGRIDNEKSDWSGL
jgi:hypothetical protein